MFKLCDFGSATTLSLTPGTDAPIGTVEEEIDKFTTLQARAMRFLCRDLRPCSFARQRWSICILASSLIPKPTFGCACPFLCAVQSPVEQALGCMLFKITFFKDAFEPSKLSILSARPPYPKTHAFSAELLQLIRACDVMCRCGSRGLNRVQATA